MLNLNKGTIKCLSCGSNFKKKTERKRIVYICSGYANYGKAHCVYNPLEEKDLMNTISKHFAVLGERIEGEIKDLIDRIDVSAGKGFTIYYKDGTTSIIDNSNDFGIKVKF